MHVHHRPELVAAASGATVTLHDSATGVALAELQATGHTICTMPRTTPCTMPCTMP